MVSPRSIRVLHQASSLWFLRVMPKQNNVNFRMKDTANFTFGTFYFFPLVSRYLNGELPIVHQYHKHPPNSPPKAKIQMYKREVVCIIHAKNRIISFLSWLVKTMQEELEEFLCFLVKPPCTAHLDKGRRSHDPVICAWCDRYFSSQETRQSASP